MPSPKIRFWYTFVMVPEKILICSDANSYYPFDDKNVWTLKEDQWKLIPVPPFIMICSDNELLEILLLNKCSCSSRELFNFGCRCQHTP